MAARGRLATSHAFRAPGPGQIGQQPRAAHAKSSGSMINVPDVARVPSTAGTTIVINRSLLPGRHQSVDHDGTGRRPVRAPGVARTVPSLSYR